MTDIEITKSIQMLNIKDVAKKISIAENDLEYYGKHKAKLPLHLIEDEKIKTSKLHIKDITFLFKRSHDRRYKFDRRTSIVWN